MRTTSECTSGPARRGTGQCEIDVELGDCKPEELIVTGVHGRKHELELLSDDGDRDVAGKKCKKAKPEQRSFRGLRTTIELCGYSFAGRLNTDSFCSNFSIRSRSSLFSMHSYSRIRSPGRSLNISSVFHGFVNTSGSSIVT